ncbi:MAG: PAS domain S-box protein [Desulfobacteraceae bacterium]|nr:PAS domain S-box protein [Desulfobacteraceae bacterium]
MMMSGKNYSIRVKLIGIILFVATVSILLAYALNGWLQYKMLKTEMKQNMKVNAQLVAEYCVPTLTFQDRAGAEEALKKLEAVPTIEAAHLFDKKGDLFSVFRRNEGIAVSKRAPPLTEGTFHRRFLHIVQPVVYQGEHYGIIHICANTIELWKKTKTLFFSLLPGMATLFFISVILAAWLQKLISGPILHLAGLTRAITVNEDFAVRAPGGGNDEIAVLCSGFNSMLEYLSIREQERDLALTDLRKSEEKYRLLIDNANDSIFIAQDGVIKFPNPKTEKLTGYSAKELVTMHIGKLIHQEDRAMVLERHTRRLQGEKIVSSYSFRIINKAGIEKIVQLNTVFIQWEGRPAALSFLRDITEQKRLEAQLQQAQKMESIGTLAGGIAHDFNNILSPIVGYTEMLIEDTPDDSPLRNGLNGIYSGALRACDLVKQILTFSHQDRNELKSIRVQPVIKEALKLIRSTIPTSIEIKQEIRSDCGSVKSDPTQIHQIIMNLTTNAYHAMEDTGELSVILKEIRLGEHEVITPDMKPGLYACLTVSDTGIGMDKQMTEKIFNPFFTTKAKGKGTGMGLSVVHGIVKSMAGAIQVRSVPGKGTDFHVYLPVGKEQPEETVVQPKDSIRGGTERIMLVDDEDAIIQMEKQMLERLGYQVVSYVDSLETLERFRAEPDQFDMVITDMAMPNMSGDKLAAELIKIRPDIPILLCTGFSEKIPENKSTCLGIKNVLMKPIAKKDLANKIREMLDGAKGGT